MFAAHERLTKDEDGHLRFADYSAGERGEMKVVLLGTIPYDNIDSVDWDGDEYYGFPHIYCFFAHKKEPYEHLGFYIETAPLAPEGLPSYEEVTSFKEVCKFSKKRMLG